MKNAHILALVITAAILCGSAPAEMYDDLVLRGEANPALADINDILIKVELPQTILFRQNPMLAGLDKFVVSCVDQARIKIRTEGPIPPDIPELTVIVRAVELTDAGQVVFFIQTSLARNVRLDEDSSFAGKAVVWMTEPVFESATVNDAPSKIHNTVSAQAKVFTHSYLMSNPHPLPKRAANAAISKASKTEESSPPAAKTSSAGYIGSKNSQVFHKPDCQSAQKILPENLVTYKTRDEAVSAGKRPCKRCNP